MSHYNERNLAHRSLRFRSKLNDPLQYYELQTVKDNVALLDQQTLQVISEVVVKAGHQLKKKEQSDQSIELNLKADSYAVESNIHFPTDISLLWDSGKYSIVDSCSERIPCPNT